MRHERDDRRSDAGDNLLEYALIVALLALASYTGLQALTASLGTTYRTWNTNLNNQAAPPLPAGPGR